MEFKLDHVVLAWSHLEALAGALVNAGLEPEYAGIHSNGATHMSLVGFEDGTYLELISVRQPGQQSPWWQGHINENGGLCGWAVQVDDVAGVVERLKALGVTVDGPHRQRREQRDDDAIEWELAYVGGEGEGAMHPFVIRDRTPALNRVKVASSVAGTELVGVDTVVIAVPDLDQAVSEFKRVYLVGDPVELDTDVFPGRVVRFEHEPIVLAAPGSKNDWLAKRLRTFGTTPCACLLATRDLDASMARFDLARRETWLGRSLAWFDTDALRPVRLGVIDAG